jgi:hypothetical protein
LTVKPKPPSGKVPAVQPEDDELARLIEQFSGEVEPLSDDAEGQSAATEKPEATPE